MLRTLTLFLLLGSVSLGYSQEHNDHHIVLKPKEKDTICIKDCLLHAHWEAHTRTFFMSTFNEGELKDDYTLGSGAGIGLLTKPLYGFQIGVSGFFMYNLLSSNIHEVDSITRQANRYEVELYDIEDHKNNHDLDRLEELYIKYSISKTSITVGKINLNTPFLNPQDGRMRPTVEEGVWLSMKESNKIGFNGGWIWEVSPRSTVRWYSLANSMGIYPMGVNKDGTKADYFEHIQGNTGMAIGNVYINPTKHIKINVWNGFLENVMNTSMIEVNIEEVKGKLKLYQGLMFTHQDAINNGGNKNQTETYMFKGEKSNVISAQFGVKSTQLNTNVNYTHITGDGRYMMPREWGKEAFYTFLSRERNEGLGNVHAFMIKSTFDSKHSKFQTTLAYGYYLLPDVKDYKLNKYGMPSYHQINYSGNYTFEKFLKGLVLRFLAAYKIKSGEAHDDPKYIYNKVNMINFNLILDFKL